MSESEAAERHADSPRRRARAAAERPGDQSLADDASQSPYAAYAPGAEAAYQPGYEPGYQPGYQAGYQAGYGTGYESSATSGPASDGYAGSAYPAADPAQGYDPGGYSQVAYGEQSYGQYPEPTSTDQQYGDQSYAGQSYAGQSYAGQSYAGQSYAGQSYADQSYAGQSYDPAAYGQQPYTDQSYDQQSYAGQSYDRQSYAGQDPYPNQQPYAGAGYGAEYADQPYSATGYPSAAGAAATSEPAGSVPYGQQAVEQSPYAVTTVNDPRTPYSDVADPVSAQVQPALTPSVPVPAAPQSPMNGSPIAPGYESLSGHQAPVGRGAEQSGGYGTSSYPTTSFGAAAAPVGYQAPAYREQDAPDDPFAPAGTGATGGGRPDTGLLLRPGRGTPDDQTWAGASAPPRRRGSRDDLEEGRPRSSRGGGVVGAVSARLGTGRQDGDRSRRPDPEPATPRQAAVSALTEIVVVLVMALGLSLIIKTFLVQAFFIPSVSMRDTLQVGDRVLVSKLTPGPFTLHRGDVVVFKDPGGWLGQQQTPVQTPVRHSLTVALTFVGLLPQDSGEHLIKRVIGLPGDTVSCDGKGKLLVNGVPIDESYVRAGNLPSAKAFTVKVQPDHLWVMGDNRGESYDSRFHRELHDGQVPMENVVGKAFVIVWPFSDAGGVTNPPSVFARVPDAPPAATK